MARRGSGPVKRGPGARGKGDLPVKVCAVCRRPFAWRKKWESVWDDVQTCSEKCRNRRKA